MRIALQAGQSVVSGSGFGAWSVDADRNAGWPECGQWMRIQMSRPEREGSDRGEGRRPAPPRPVQVY